MQTVEKDTAALNEETAPKEIQRFLSQARLPSEGFAGRGIVICAGGKKHFTNAWIAIKMLRRMKVSLPIELWYLGKREMDKYLQALIEPFGVKCIDALALRDIYPVRILRGWELKPYAILHSSFREVLYLDADNFAVRNPERLFDEAQYKKAGALFWPDFGRLAPQRSIWKVCGVHYQDEPEFESGQILVDKVRCWKALQLTMWMNEHSDFFYRHMHGDKETFHMAFRRTETPHAVCPYPIDRLPGTMCQHDFAGNRLFQHRNLRKFRFHGPNRPVRGFWYEEECLEYLAQLQHKWDGRIGGKEGRE